VSGVSDKHGSDEEFGFCSNCGAGRQRDDRFCAFCGKALTEQTSDPDAPDLGETSETEPTGTGSSGKDSPVFRRKAFWVAGVTAVVIIGAILFGVPQIRHQIIGRSSNTSSEPLHSSVAPDTWIDTQYALENEYSLMQWKQNGTSVTGTIVTVGASSTFCQPNVADVQGMINGNAVVMRVSGPGILGTARGVIANNEIEFTGEIRGIFKATTVNAWNRETGC